MNQEKKGAEGTPPLVQSDGSRLFLACFEALAHECLALRPLERLGLGLGITGFHFCLLCLLSRRRCFLLFVGSKGSARNKGKLSNEGDHGFHQ